MLSPVFGYKNTTHTCVQVVSFNSHAHVGRNLYDNEYLSYGVNFNSHAHVGRDPKYCVNKVMPPLMNGLLINNNAVLFTHNSYYV